MSKGTLLVAGPLALDDLPEGKGLIGGGGGYAAIAATALCPTQLWARGGEAFDSQLQTVLTNRRIDLAGTTWEGPTARWIPPTYQASGDVLPAVEPSDPEDVGAVLLIDLPPREGRRAIAAISALPGATGRPVLIAPRPEDCRSDRTYLSACAAAADVLILPASLAANLTTSPLALAEELVGLGARCVCLTQGVFGGLLVYQQKTTTWPAMPIIPVETTGVGSAFVGTLASWCARNRKADFATVKRGLALASAMATICAQGIGPKRLMQTDEKVLLERFARLRRAHKF